MTLMQRIGRVGQGLESGWDEADVERVWQGLKRKRRRRAIAAGGAASVAGAAALAVFVVVGRDAAVPQAVRRSTADRPAAQASPPGLTRFADGSTAVPASGREASLAVVEDTPARVVVALARGGARFDVVPRRERVFSVRAGDVTVSVLGTAFSVERVANRIGVAVTRGAVLVDWGVGARRLAAGDEGWFPPLLVAPPPAGDGHAEAAALDARRVRHGGARSGLAPPGLIERTPDAPPPPAPGPPNTVAPETGAATLLADADRARLAGRFEEGAGLLQRLLREHPVDPRAPVAAFSLGRVLLGELGRPAEAAAAFERARVLAPNGPLAEDALAREVEAWSRAGDPARARARAGDYLRAYPNGRRAAAVNDAVRSNW